MRVKGSRGEAHESFERRETDEGGRGPRPTRTATEASGANTEAFIVEHNKANWRQGSYPHLHSLLGLITAHSHIRPLLPQPPCRC